MTQPSLPNQQNLLKSHLAKIRDAALVAVDPYQAVINHLGFRLEVSGQSDLHKIHHTLLNLSRNQRVLLIAVGKAAIRMTQGVINLYGDYISKGIVVTKYGHACGHSLPEKILVIESGHPQPDESGLEAARLCHSLLTESDPWDLVIMLLSGGASALMPLPVPSISLAEIQSFTASLFNAGATIQEINAVRKHLDQLKGGQLVQLAAPAPILSLILSDVVGDPLDVIASGLTSPDPTTFAHAFWVLKRYDLLGRVSPAILSYLESGEKGNFPETPKPGHEIFNKTLNCIIGSNRQAAQAAIKRAADLGYKSLLLTTFLEGEAREVGKLAAALIRGIRQNGDPLSAPACLVLGGETTVTVRGNGKGGRNQELALSAAISLAGVEQYALMALATDGSDGPTDAAGAIVDGGTYSRIIRAGFDPLAALQDNNSYPVLEASGDLLRIGPTGTNVNDLLVILVGL